MQAILWYPKAVKGVCLSFNLVIARLLKAFRKTSAFYYREKRQTKQNINKIKNKIMIEDSSALRRLRKCYQEKMTSDIFICIALIMLQYSM